MARCCVCGEKKETPWVFHTGEPLCDSCSGKFSQCPECSLFFEHEQMVGNFCPKCDMLEKN